MELQLPKNIITYLIRIVQIPIRTILHQSDTELQNCQHHTLVLFRKLSLLRMLQTVFGNGVFQDGIESVDDGHPVEEVCFRVGPFFQDWCGDGGDLGVGTGGEGFDEGYYSSWL